MGLVNLWKYKRSGKVKHYFGTKERPFCGAASMCPNDVWHSDEEGLKVKKQCKKCVQIMVGI